jgi:hypothetical protein
MNIAPSEEFLAACRAVLGDDRPETIITVLRSHDLALVERLRAAHAEVVDTATSEASSPGDVS